MSTVTPTDYMALDLPSLAFAIVSENGRAIRTAKTAVDHAIRCGEMLIAAKAKVPHGEWESWVSTETEISLRTASRYMQSALKSATLADLEPDLVIAEALEMVTTPATVKRESAKATIAPKPAAAVTMDAEIVEPLTEKESTRLAELEKIIENGIKEDPAITSDSSCWGMARDFIEALKPLPVWQERQALCDVRDALLRRLHELDKLNGKEKPNVIKSSAK